MTGVDPQAPQAVNSEVVQAMRRLGLGRGQAVRAMTQLTGGVSSDIWRIDLEDHSLCAKRALGQLKVSAHWEAPLSRNAYEYAWYEHLSAEFGRYMPQVLGRDERAGVFFMTFLEPEQHPVWKQRLLKGQVDPDFAHHVGDCLGRFHHHTARQARVAQAFKSDAEFFSLRLEPYLLATAQRHPALAARLQTLCTVTADTHLALVHGDISPKNILCGPQGPVFLDAECAWYGDPAFDLAFCLNHLLLKAVHLPAQAGALSQSFVRLAGAYLPAVSWEPVAGFEQRAAQLLPALLLARVDGKSPVEYVTEDSERNVLRRAAIQALQHPPRQLREVLDITLKEVSR